MAFRPDPVASVLIFGCGLIGSNALLRTMPYTPSVAGADRAKCSSCSVAVPLPALTPQETRELAKPPASSIVRDDVGARDVLIALGRRNTDLVSDMRASIVVARRGGLRPRIEVAEVDAEYWTSRLGDLLRDGRGRLDVRHLSAAGTLPYVVYRAGEIGLVQVPRAPQEVLPNIVFRVATTTGMRHPEGFR